MARCEWTARCLFNTRPPDKKHAEQLYSSVCALSARIPLTCRRPPEHPGSTGKTTWRRQESSSSTRCRGGHSRTRSGSCAHPRGWFHAVRVWVFIDATNTRGGQGIDNDYVVTTSPQASKHAVGECCGQTAKLKLVHDTVLLSPAVVTLGLLRPGLDSMCNPTAWAWLLLFRYCRGWFASSPGAEIRHVRVVVHRAPDQSAVQGAVKAVPA